MKNSTKIILKVILLFVIFSFLGSLIEFSSRFLGGSGRAYDNGIFLLTGLKIYFIYLYGLVGIILLFIEKLYDKLKIKLRWRGLLNGISITIIELISGLITIGIWGFNFWDYSNKLLNFKGIISLPMFLLWTIFGYLFSLFYKFIYKKLNKNSKKINI
ncbi:MAG: hypothetical protein WC979_09125 [Candidatus Pacearchaeota archaeon]|jgi:uncharacterized membrane protein